MTDVVLYVGLFLSGTRILLDNLKFGLELRAKILEICDQLMHFRAGAEIIISPPFGLLPSRTSVPNRSIKTFFRLVV